MGNMAGHEMMLVMNVAVKAGDALIWHQDIQYRFSVLCSPVPLRVQVKEWAVGQDHDWGVWFYPLQICLNPTNLCVSNHGGRVVDIVQEHEMHALVIKAVVQVS